LLSVVTGLATHCTTTEGIRCAPPPGSTDGVASHQTRSRNRCRARRGARPPTPPLVRHLRESPSHDTDRPIWRKLVSFFRMPLPIPWRHIQSLRDADQPVRKVPSRDGYPRGSSRIVQRWWEMKDPVGTVHPVVHTCVVNHSDAADSVKKSPYCEGPEVLPARTRYRANLKRLLATATLGRGDDIHWPSDWAAKNPVYQNVP
jgi:hypothetical protein